MDADKKKKLLDRAIDFATAAGEKVSFKLDRLSEPVRTVLVVEVAQGIIDNGGLRYFFESDFDGQPPYEDFCDAYRRIGANDCADALKQAVEMFPFDNPHLDAEQRNIYLDLFYADEDDSEAFAELDDILVGNEPVWEKMADYVTKHRTAFGNI
jgi:hypothetical protein